MRVRIVWGLYWLLLTAAWWVAAAPLQMHLDAADAAWWWQLRQQALYLSGVWSIGMMSLVMLLSLRQRWMEQPLGGMDQVYRLHKWAGISAALFAVLHWGAKESSGWIKDIWGTAGRPARDAVLAAVTQWRGTGKDLGEWAFYAVLIMVVLTLWQRLLPYRLWRRIHRVMPVLYLMLAFHTLVLMPLVFWQSPLGVLVVALLALGSGAAVWSLSGRIGRGRNSYVAQLHTVQMLGQDAVQAPLEVVCALPAQWPGHAPGQFVFASFDGAEGPHPFTIASAPGSCGQSADGRVLLRLVIKPLGDYTRTLHAALQAGQTVRIEGPYGKFDGRGRRQCPQVWVAGGVGITPFLALLEARQPCADARSADEGQQAAVLHYCTRSAADDPLMPCLQALCAQAQPSVHLQVHDAARGKYLQPQDLEKDGTALDIWFCGPVGLGKVLQRAAIQQRGWYMHQEAFAMR